MTPERRHEIASAGGKAQGKHNNRGNFAHNRERAREAGRLGGLVKKSMREGTPQ
jgi:general stress protein YciG